MNSDQSLTTFGASLAAAVQKRDKSFVTSVKNWKESYAQNLELIDRLRSIVAQKSSALVLGAGPLKTNIDLSHLSSSYTVSGVQWTDFNDKIELDILLSTHVAPLQASFNRISLKKKPVIIHGIYSKCPPVLSNSITFRWSDPLLNKNWIVKPTVSALDEIIRTKAYGPAPYMPAVRNVVFLNAMILMWLGAKQVIFAGIDPYNPVYYFNGNKQKSLEIIQAISLINPYISIWDGRNERIGKLNRETDHRVQEIISDLSLQKSAVGDNKRLDVMRKGFKIIKKYSQFKGVDLGYIGDSAFLEECGLKQID